jgi:UDP-2,3-diacylglucosamine pyrophosphatase LpxH
LVRRRLGYPYWSLSAYLKQKVKNAVEYIGNYEHAIAEEARRRGVDGVICGHIHKAEMREIGPVLYCNTGDWVESCTALVEHRNGQLEIIDWPAVRKLSMLQVTPELATAR